MQTAIETLPTNLPAGFSFVLQNESAVCNLVGTCGLIPEPARPTAVSKVFRVQQQQQHVLICIASDKIKQRTDVSMGSHIPASPSHLNPLQHIRQLQTPKLSQRLLHHYQ